MTPELYRKHIRKDEHTGGIYIPMLMICPNCHKPHSVFDSIHGTVHGPMLAYEISLLKFVSSGDMHKQVSTPYTRPCDCDEKRIALQQAVGPIIYENLTDDSDWILDNSSRPSRGYHHYIRMLQLTHPLTPMLEAMLIMYLNYTDCPGYTGIHSERLTPTLLKLTTTYDSGD